jgi:hypothetical protein
MPSGDVNGDGFASPAALYQWGGVLGGVAPRAGASSLGASLTGYGHTPRHAVGDLDADGVADECALSDEGGELRCAASATAPVRTLRACGTTALPSTFDPAVRMLAQDLDGDGYDDLRLDAVPFDHAPTASVLYRGGPSGIAEARCALLP